MKYTCPCCGYKTLDEEPPGTYDICTICFWEDDGVQFDDPDWEGGANLPSLRQAQKTLWYLGLVKKGAWSLSENQMIKMKKILIGNS